MPHAILTIGYNQFEIPSSIKLDQIKEIVNAKPLTNFYGKAGFGYTGKKEVSIQVVGDDEISWIKVADDLDEIQEEIAEQIITMIKKSDEQEKSIYFTQARIKIGDDSVDWPDFENPEFDPKEFILNVFSQVH